MPLLHLWAFVACSGAIFTFTSHNLIYLKIIALGFRHKYVRILTLNLLTTTIVAPPSNASKWQMGFNSAFKWLTFRRREFSFKF